MIKLNINKETKAKILALTKGKITPFSLRKKAGEDALEMTFYTKPKTIRVENKVFSCLNRVTIPYHDNLKKGGYYLVDESMNVTSLK